MQFGFVLMLLFGAVLFKRHRARQPHTLLKSDTLTGVPEIGEPNFGAPRVPKIGGLVPRTTEPSSKGLTVDFSTLVCNSVPRSGNLWDIRTRSSAQVVSH